MDIVNHRPAHSRPIPQTSRDKRSICQTGSDNKSTLKIITFSPPDPRKKHSESQTEGHKQHTLPLLGQDTNEIVKVAGNYTSGTRSQVVRNHAKTPTAASHIR
jgi:hypothetical protein